MADAAPPPMGDLFSQYNPEGAANGLFAPAYIAGYAPSEKAVNDWSAKHHTDISVIDESRMPSLWNAPDVNQTAPGVWAPAPSFGGMSPGSSGNVYGAGNISNNISFGLDKGIADPNALRAVAQGTEYKTSDARRASIAERLAYNEAAKDAYQMRANARGEAGLTGGADPKAGGYGSGDLYTPYMKQNNPSGFNQPLLINNNPGGSGYISGPTDNWPANIPGNPNAGSSGMGGVASLPGANPGGATAMVGRGGSAANLSLINPPVGSQEWWMLHGSNFGDSAGAGGSAGGED